jgi:hypothetical protein
MFEKQCGLPQITTTSGSASQDDDGIRFVARPELSSGDLKQGGNDLMGGMWQGKGTNA